MSDDGVVQATSIVHIVWSPRRIEKSLAAHEALGEALDIETAFIVGYNEHEGCAKANEIVRGIDADVYLLSYDDQCPTPEQARRVLEAQAYTGDVVSGWQCLGQDSPYGSATRRSWGIQPLQLTIDCFYTRSELRFAADQGGYLMPSNYLAALTAVPRAWMLESPMWAMPSGTVQGDALKIWPSRDGKPYDKGCASDWTLAMDLIDKGHRIWVAPDVEVEHLAPLHGVPAHKFWMAEEPQGVYWNHRPRNESEFAPYVEVTR